MRERIIFFFVGLLILTLGVALIIKANLGASSWDALAVGESTTFGITVGTCVFINGIILIFINAFLLKRRPEVFAALSIFIIGLLIDFWLLIGLKNFAPENPGVQWAALAVGILALGIGVAVYLQAKFPSSPMDTIMIAISERFGLSLRSSRMISEGLALALAVAFGGAVGIGTIIVTLSLGFIVQFFFPKFERLLHGWSEKLSFK
ncbi:YczE/YyaS/YitT family protein [Bacillus sp. SCS-153A]|uniref:YczE/YyaS/YitT family protein n=1 Tax=Rossellomorea sedimentorum TaxID=3115294 RepID=UPI00390616FA